MFYGDRRLRWRIATLKAAPTLRKLWPRPPTLRPTLQPEGGKSFCRAVFRSSVANKAVKRGAKRRLSRENSMDLRPAKSTGWVVTTYSEHVGLGTYITDHRPVSKTGRLRPSAIANGLADSIDVVDRSSRTKSRAAKNARLKLRENAISVVEDQLACSFVSFKILSLRLSAQKSALLF